MTFEAPARLPFHYLHVVADGAGAIQAIVSLDLWEPTAAVVIRKAYGHRQGERGIVADFCKSTHFFNRKWNWLPCGVWLDLDFAALWKKAKKYGLLDAFEDRNDWQKPCIDLGPLAVLANGGQFRGAQLSAGTNTGHDIGKLLESAQHHAAEARMVSDALAFKALFHRLLAETPSFLSNLTKLETTP